MQWPVSVRRGDTYTHTQAEETVWRQAEIGAMQPLTQTGFRHRVPSSHPRPSAAPCGRCTLTVAHALHEVLEGLGKLGRLQEKRGEQHCQVPEV